MRRDFTFQEKLQKNLLKKYLVGNKCNIIKKNIFDKLKFKSKYQVIGDFDFFKIKFDKKLLCNTTHY